MLTATQARELAQRSDTTIERWTATICAAIERSAQKGELSYKTENILEFTVIEPSYVTVQPTDLALKVQERLRMLGYAVKWDCGRTTKAGGGLGDMSDPEDRPDVRRWSLHISW